ncbi:MAG TPA: CapA family protein, partial [Gemmatimonadaceae bacterium]
MTARALSLALAIGCAAAGPARAQADTTRRPPRAPADTIRPGRALPDTARPRRDTLEAPPTDSVRATPLRVCAGGDVTLGTNLDRAWSRAGARALRTRWNLSPDPDSLLAPIAPLVADADVVLLNVEGAIGEGPAPSKCGRGSRNCFAFRMPASAAPAIRRVAPAAAVVGNLANNHARDAGREGTETTAALLERAGVLVTGIDSLPTLVPTPRGDTIAVLGFYTNGDSNSTTPDARDLAGVRRHVARAAERWGTVIATVHIGAEGAMAQRTANRTEKFLRMDRGNPVAFADSAFAGGATLVVGHGPHVMRAAQWRDDGAKLSLYSLGNLITYGPFAMREPLNRGAIACVDIDSGRVVAADLRPTVQLAAGVIRPDSALRAVVLVDSLGRLDFPRSGARVGADGKLIPPSAPEAPSAPMPDSTRRDGGR